MIEIVCGPQSQKYLLSAPLQKNLWTPTWTNVILKSFLYKYKFPFFHVA